MNKLHFIVLAIVFCLANQIKATNTDIPTKQEKEFYDYLYRLSIQGNLDSVKYVFENQNIDLKRYDTDNKHFTPIVYAAAYSGNTDLVKYLVGKGADLKAHSSNNETALHRAAWRGDLAMVKLLVEYGADLNIVYNANGGLSPLCCAAESGNIEVVKYLIEKGANVNYTNKDSGASPLRSAAYKAHYDIFLLLAQKQPAAYNWQEALFYGLIGGNPDIVKYIVEEKGADVNKKSQVWKEYPIHRAVEDKYVFEKNARSLEVVKYLVSKGARLSDINESNMFEWAMRNCTEPMIEYLIEQDAIPMPTLLSGRGWTPLATALDNSNFALANHLIKKTTDYTFRGQPLIVYFADGMYNSAAIIDFLIKEGVNKEYYNEALESSVLHNDSLSVELLLAAGANVKYLNAEGSNLLHLARSCAVAKLLIEKGADTWNKIMLEGAWKNPLLLRALDDAGVVPPISQTDMNGALATAAHLGDKWTVEYMLRRGADVDSYSQKTASEEERELEREIYADSDEDEDDEESSEEKERAKESQTNNVPVYKQTPLIRNAIQGYSSCNYGNYRDENSKVQVSADIARILLNAGANPNIVDANGKTALHYAAGNQWCRVGIWPIPMGNRRDREHGAHGDPASPPLQYHDSIAALLIGHGADLNVKDRNGNTPLILAAMSRNHDVLKMLLKAEADFKVKNNGNKDLFSFLDDQPSFQIIKDAGLWKYMPKERLNTAFRKFFTDYRPRSRYDVEELKRLIAYGADVNTKMYQGDSMNALVYTFDRMYGDNKFEIAQALIDGGIDLNAENHYGYTLPMLLIKKSEERERYSNDKTPVNLDFLIKNKININYKSRTQFTALTIAICEDKKETTGYLLKHGAKRDRQSEWWYLIKERYYDPKTIPMLRQLVKEGVGVNLQTPAVVSEYVPMLKQKGVTALMFFVAYGREDGVKALLQMGANVNKKAADGTTALVIAKDRRKQSIIDLLLQAGAKE
ncbi:ankyrin repeat protein [Dysgonomonas sp. PH5-45]|uniref:ankyrin repeat domain-containing protein n=1 Tax=unclassified Dysgonomonas TaxID=2630389 RepID=UPI002473EADC|nr:MULTISPECIES: ankyrin repeat domain-containing protein [unclassified Dysgonomonas]MDH6355626.1 ankyrin repeat protein [Dysgonomonas sp. PH5-45]MDH6388523.1 ankyrin repeat protein [Dysgonomonas sp. PH5-37]